MQRNLNSKMRIGESRHKAKQEAREERKAQGKDLREKNTEGKNTYLALQEARGKYIYNCEGDDFWIGRASCRERV